MPRGDAAPAPTNAMSQAQKAAQLNMYLRNLVLARGIKMTQQIFSQAGINTANTPQINITAQNMRMVGLGLRFWVEVKGTITNTGVTAATITLSGFGPANVLASITMNDTSNNVRHNCTGWYLHMANSLRHFKPFCAANTLTTYPVSWGNTFDVSPNGIIRAPTTIAGNSATGTFNMLYEVPMAYSDQDLRGAINLGVTNATMNLQLNFNQAPVVASTADPTNAVYQSNTTVTSGTNVMTSVTVTVYQEYYDQLPMGPQGPAMPFADMAWMYMLQTWPYSGIVQAADFPISYPNFRQILTSTVLFDNSTSGGANNPGTDIAYLAEQAANTTFFYKTDPFLKGAFTRMHLGDDPPPGVYIFNHRNKPIDTIQFGNVQIILNASLVAAAAPLVTVGYEMMALTEQVKGASSLAISP